MYAAFYMSRYNFTVSNPALCSEFGWDNTRIGIIISISTAVYGLSVFFNGPLADKIGGKKAILIGCIGALVFNLLFALGAIFKVFAWDAAPWTRLFTYLAAIWTLNMYFQSFGALSVVKVNAAWFPMQERGIFAGLFGAMIQFGRILAVPVGGVILVTSGWVWVHIIPTIVLATVGIITIIFVRDTPEELGFTRQDDKLEGEESEPSISSILKMIFGNPTLWIITGAMICTGIIRHSIEQWSPKYFNNYHNLASDSMIFILAFAGQVMVGIFGAFVMGNVSDKYFQSRRGPVTAIAYGAQALLLIIFVLVRPGPLAAALLLMLIYFFLNGCHGLIAGTASMDFGGRKAAATAAGMLDGFQYLIGGAFAGAGIGKIIDIYGWNAWFVSIIPFALVAGVLMATRWNVLPRKAGKEEVVLCVECGEPAPAQSQTCPSCGKQNLSLVLKSVAIKAKEAFNTGIFSILMVLFPIVILGSKILGGIIKPETKNPHVNSVLIFAFLGIAIGLLARMRSRKAAALINTAGSSGHLMEIVAPARSMAMTGLIAGVAATVYGLYWLLKGTGLWVGP
jgi:OPA family glycerol-3-phosphate transporter-like MFS transporter